jgi:hypothetical protein
MARLPSDEVLDALVDIFDPDRYRPDPLGEPGWRYDHTTGMRVYSSSWLSDAVEGHERPDELEIRRRQRELAGIDRTRGIGRGRGR